MVVLVNLIRESLQDVTACCGKEEVLLLSFQGRFSFIGGQDVHSHRLLYIKARDS